MKIDLTKIIEIDKDKNIALPVYPSLFENELIFGINIESIKDENIKENYCYLINLNPINNFVKWKIKLENSNPNQIRTKVKKINDIIFICSNYEFLALEINSGREIWRKEFKKFTDPEISIVNNRLFFSNWGEIQELNINNGKKISSKKPRVKWFDSNVVRFNNRFFVSTSNSKIIEFSSELDVLNEYKFPGGWAIGCEPLINNGHIISSSYGGKIISFDLESNLPIKKMNKKAGSKPNQIKIGEYGFFYEGHLDNKLTCYNLNNYKKKWSSQIERVQSLSNIKEKLVSIFKQKGKYLVGEINASNGTIEKIIDESVYKNWERYKWDLWEGVGIDSNEQTLVFAFEPNLITIKKSA